MEVAATPNSEQFPQLFMFELMIDLMGKNHRLETIDGKKLSIKHIAIAQRLNTEAKLRRSASFRRGKCVISSTVCFLYSFKVTPE